MEERHRENEMGGRGERQMQKMRERAVGVCFGLKCHSSVKPSSQQNNFPRHVKQVH